MKIINVNEMFGKYGSDDTRRFTTLDLKSGKPGEIRQARHTSKSDAEIAESVILLSQHNGDGVDRAYYQAQIRALLEGPASAPKFKRIAIAIAAAYHQGNKKK